MASTIRTDLLGGVGEEGGGPGEMGRGEGGDKCKK